MFALKQQVGVAQIKELRLIRKSEVDLGGGGAAGAMNALMGGDDEVYDMTLLDFADQREMFRFMLAHVSRANPVAARPLALARALAARPGGVATR